MSLFANRASRRVKKIWWFSLALLLGTCATTAIVAWVEVARNTDLADPTIGITARDKDESQAVDSPIWFTDVTAALGVVMRHGPGPRRRLLPEDTGSGLAWADYDRDGDWDLYVVNFPSTSDGADDPQSSNRLYRNDQGRFTDVTAAAGVGDPSGFGMGASFADYDGDGDVDLYVTNVGPNRLFRNRGDGTFEEVAAAAGVDDLTWSTGAAWGDYDRDGDLDLYVSNYVRFDAGDLQTTLAETSQFGQYAVPFTLNPNSFDPAPNRLYRNRGDGTFEEVAEACGIDNPTGRSFGATFCDLDGDGWLDLYVVNDVSENKLYRNTLGDPAAEQFVGKKPPFVVALSQDFGQRRDGTISTFVDLSAVTGTADPRGSMGLSVGEIGNLGGGPDGLPDLFITHWIAEENAFYQSKIMPDGFLEYRDKTRQFRLGEISIDNVGWGCALADLDLDGRADIIVANGSTLERTNDVTQLTPQPLFLFWNDGHAFRNVASTAGDAFRRLYNARGLAVADFDGDGDPDLAFSVNRGAPVLLRNDTSLGYHALRIRLRGRPAACFGARVEVMVAGRAQYQWWAADVTYLGVHAPELIFGLGAHAAADSVRVRWADGTESARSQVPAGVTEIEADDAG